MKAKRKPKAPPEVLSFAQMVLKGWGGAIVLKTSAVGLPRFEQEHLERVILKVRAWRAVKPMAVRRAG